MVICLGLKKMLFVSCNPTPTSFSIKKNRYPKVFSALPNPNQRKTCIKHTFLTKKIMPKKCFTDLSTLFLFRLLQETSNIFWPYGKLIVIKWFQFDFCKIEDDYQIQHLHPFVLIAAKTGMTILEIFYLQTFF